MTRALVRTTMTMLAPYLLTGPAIVFVAVFLYAPVLFSVGLSFSDWNFIHPEARFVGLDNYVQVLGDPYFREAAWNTALYCIVLIPAQIVIPLALAAFLLRVGESRAGRIYKPLLFLPTILAYSTAGIAWLWLFDPLNGFLNTVLTTFGQSPSRWYTDPDLALWTVAIVTFWKTFGLNMLLFLAAMASIPKDVLEAATIDRAGPFTRFRTIELPLISPTFFFVAVTTSFGVLDDIVGVIDVLTGGGPYGSSTNILYYMFERGLKYFQFGQASAASVIIIALVLVVTWAQFRLLEQKVHYES